MKRCIALTVAWFSGAVFLFVMLIWVRSMFVSDIIRPSGEAGRPTVWIESRRGQIGFELFPQRMTTREQSVWLRTTRARLGWLDPISQSTTHHVMGFGFERTQTSWRAVTPYWPWAGLAAILPAVVLLRRERRRRRLAAGLCVRCGYDLRESRESCPECGETIPTAG